VDGRAAPEAGRSGEVEARSPGESDGRNGDGDGSEGEGQPRPDRKPPKAISPSDPSSAWTAKANKRAQFGYGLNYLVDVEHAVIVDVEATPARTYDEVVATRTMIDLGFPIARTASPGPLAGGHVPLTRMVEIRDAFTAEIEKLRQRIMRDRTRVLSSVAIIAASAFSSRTRERTSPLLRGTQPPKAWRAGSARPPAPGRPTRPHIDIGFEQRAAA
jgi:hypothetical protein